MRSVKFYGSKLTRYFDQHFKGYEDSAEWYVDPAPNMWVFKIETIGVIVLTCDDDGNVTETVTRK